MDTSLTSSLGDLARSPRPVGHNNHRDVEEEEKSEDSMQKARNFKTNSSNTNVIVVKFVFPAKSRCKMRSKLDAKQKQKQTRALDTDLADSTINRFQRIYGYNRIQLVH